MRVKSIVILLPFILFTGGCAVGYNSTLFMTKSNVGIDVDTKPPTAEISISRREGVIAPSFEGGQTPPVLAIFRAASGDWPKLSAFFFGVDSTFAGGDAAVVLSQEPNGEAEPDSRLCLNKKPDAKKTLWIWNRAVPEKDKVSPFFFATDTTLGLKLAWSGTTGVHPDTLRLGFSRKESAWAPVLKADPNKCKIPGTEKNGEYAVKMPSFLAILDSNTQTEENGNIKTLQYFATGESATNLAKDGTILKAFQDAAQKALKVN